MDAVDQLNFHHLRYFWIVVREGGIAPASRALRLSHSTLSAQIQQLSDHLGAPLFIRAGRRLVLTEEGELVRRHADDIFARGRDLIDALRGEREVQRARLHIGVVDIVPKMVVRKLLEPALHIADPARLVVREAGLDRLLGELAAFQADLIISDSPVPPGSPVRAHAHALGTSTVTWFAAPTLARALTRDFPRSLDGAPVLLPLEGLPMRRAVDRELARLRIRPRVVAEFEDSALLKSMGGAGAGAFLAPSAVSDEVMRQYRVQVLGALPLRERYYAITAQRRVTHPGVNAILAQARTDLFG